mmetsp:Transcript_83973/g.216146  ORF Transcript_83973/g.216146 Transcript_83973/m.216146 type:complete len:342 (+) Transcript_83973:254-1279(+)
MGVWAEKLKRAGGRSGRRLLPLLPLGLSSGAHTTLDLVVLLLQLGELELVLAAAAVAGGRGQLIPLAAAVQPLQVVHRAAVPRQVARPALGVHEGVRLGGGVHGRDPPVVRGELPGQPARGELRRLDLRGLIHPRLLGIAELLRPRGAQVNDLLEAGVGLRDHGEQRPVQDGHELLHAALHVDLWLQVGLLVWQRKRALGLQLLGLAVEAVQRPDEGVPVLRAELALLDHGDLFVEQLHAAAIVSGHEAVGPALAVPPDVEEDLVLAAIRVPRALVLAHGVLGDALERLRIGAHLVPTARPVRHVHAVVQAAPSVAVDDVGPRDQRPGLVRDVHHQGDLVV